MSTFIELTGPGRQHGYVVSTVASGDTESDVADLKGFFHMGLLVPTIDAGAITFEASHLSDGTFRPVKLKNGTDFTITSGTGNMALRFGANRFVEPYRFVKVVCATVQTDDREFTWVLKA